MASWYKNTRDGFLNETIDNILSHLHKTAAMDGWHIDPDQDEEWRLTIQDLKSAIDNYDFDFIDGILVEYDFRRRGIRIDFILVVSGALFVLEFKRGTLSAADRDQVMNYCVNLVEFHELTQVCCPKLFPVLISRKANAPVSNLQNEWHEDWPQIYRNVVTTKASLLGNVILHLRRLIPHPLVYIDFDKWDNAPFHPSSSIIDAAISLYGQHDVSAINAHAVPKENIDKCIDSVINEIDKATAEHRHELIVVSGAPGSGKTLIGLAIAFHNKYRGDAVFVTGNAPLVDVLNGSLKRSYMKLRKQGRSKALAGYTKTGVSFVEKNSDFKIVKAHSFLESTRITATTFKERASNSSDGRILVFDEAQRTYAEGTIVNRKSLNEDEAMLIIEEMAQRVDSIIVLLIGHNQNINVGELGVNAWLKASRKYGWPFAISNETLMLFEFQKEIGWTNDKLRIEIQGTHLSQSIRDQKTRNGEIEQWAHLVMTNIPIEAVKIAKTLDKNSAIYITRSLIIAKNWAQHRRVGEDRCGLIASGQGRRLRPDGIFVDEKPNIVDWILAPSDDIRSSNMLEQTQNQYQIQGLELDFTIVCWDADLRRINNKWDSYKVTGAGWNRSAKEDEARCNSYRVLLTRSRKGMVIFVPGGDKSKSDPTRNPQFYDDIFNYIVQCGAVKLDSDNDV